MNIFKQFLSKQIERWGTGLVAAALIVVGIAMVITILVIETYLTHGLLLGSIALVGGLRIIWKMICDELERTF